MPQNQTATATATATDKFLGIVSEHQLDCIVSKEYFTGIQYTDLCGGGGLFVENTWYDKVGKISSIMVIPVFFVMMAVIIRTLVKSQ